MLESLGLAIAVRLLGARIWMANENAASSLGSIRRKMSCPQIAI
jgi:hypothetical protein